MTIENEVDEIETSIVPVAPAQRVDERTLVRRINKKLATEDKVLRKPRGATWWYTYYIYDRKYQCRLDKEIDFEELRKLGNQLGVLSPDERFEVFSQGE